jgi:phage shock protein A
VAQEARRVSVAFLTMDDAIKKVRQLAASALARKEKLEEELSAVEAEKKQREAQRELALSSGDDELALKLTQLVGDLHARLELKRDEIAAADDAYREILVDLRAVQDAAKEQERLVQRAPIDAALEPDPFGTSAEDAALENVRQHIETLSARAELEDELNASRKSDRELAKRLADLEKQEAEEKAKAQLAELKAKRKKEAAPSGNEEPPPPKKPKKTM